MRRLALLTLCLIACGGGPGSFTGTVASNTFKVNGSAFMQGQEIWLTSMDKPCDHLKANEFPKGGVLLKIVPHPAAASELTVMLSTTANGTATLQFLKLDDNCNNTLSFGASGATKGTVKIDFVEAMKSAAGRFDVTFGNSDAASGTFNAAFCDAPLLYDMPKCVDLGQPK